MSNKNFEEELEAEIESRDYKDNEAMSIEIKYLAQRVKLLEKYLGILIEKIK